MVKVGEIVGFVVFYQGIGVAHFKFADDDIIRELIFVNIESYALFRREDKKLFCPFPSCVVVVILFLHDRRRMEIWEGL